MTGTMAKRTRRPANGEGSDLRPSGDDAGLSQNMRDLILRFDAKERRKLRRVRAGTGSSAKRRRGDVTGGDGEHQGET